jgi:hypothetical protein
MQKGGADVRQIRAVAQFTQITGTPAVRKPGNSLASGLIAARAGVTSTPMPASQPSV